MNRLINKVFGQDKPAIYISIVVNLILLLWAITFKHFAGNSILAIDSHYVILLAKKNFKKNSYLQLTDRKQSINSFNYYFAIKQFPYSQHFIYKKPKNLAWIISLTCAITLLTLVLLIEIISRSNLNKKILKENELTHQEPNRFNTYIFWETNALGHFTYLSKNIENSYNIKHQEILGKHLSELFVNKSDLNFNWYLYQKKVNAQMNLDNFIFSIRDKDRKLRIIQIDGRPIYDLDRNFIGYRGTQKEITTEYNLSQTIAYQSSYDCLTGLINRRRFNDYLNSLVKNIKNTSNLSVICILNLDRFKIINNISGYLVGDLLLIEVANILRSCIRKQDILGRLEGDEFGLLLISTSINEAKVICHKIIDRIKNHQFYYNHRLFDISISIGVLSIDNRAFSTTELLSKANLACYKAKDLGRGRMHIIDRQNQEIEQNFIQMEYIANISQAIKRQQFYLVKQSIQSLSDRGTNYKHYEILLRYRDEYNNIISPKFFIPFAEKYGVITIIDRWVIETIFNNYQEYFPDQKTMISINLSAISISDLNFLQYVIEFINSSPIDPNFICFEITETAAIPQISQAKKFISTLKKLGVKFALDDFGSGVSSFGYLKSLPVDYLKIDGSLIKNIVREESDRAIVDSINYVARIMGIKTIAEFVENEKILAVLAEIGVDYVQGYYIDRPTNLT